MKIGGESEQATWRSPSYCLENIVTLVEMCSLETSNHTHSFITTFLKFPFWLRTRTHTHTHNCVCWNTLLGALGQFCGHTFREVLSVSISLTLWTVSFVSLLLSLPPATPHTQASDSSPCSAFPGALFPIPGVFRFSHCVRCSTSPLQWSFLQMKRKTQ